MNYTIHKADERGNSHYDWLISKHSFSFAEYYNPEKMGFGLLRVLNDDVVLGGYGFESHPHKNMEIISIPLSGALEHKDSIGNTSVIKTHDVQIMSAGTGVIHSEFNHSKTETVNFLQLWILPQQKNIAPHYQQLIFNPEKRKNILQNIVSPEKSDSTLWINQDAYLYLSSLEKNSTIEYQLHKKEHGVYIFVLEGNILVEKQTLKKRDAIGVWNTTHITIQAATPSEFLLIEVPMQ